MNWNLLTLIVATLLLIAAAVLPFAQKKYEENKAKFSFRMYINDQLGYIFNLANYNKIDYIQPTISDNFSRKAVTFTELARRIRDDFREHQNSVEPRILFHFINNLQKYCHHIYQIRHCITKIDTVKLKENVLANGEKLSKDELKKIYGLLMVIGNFNTISLFHDRFANLKSVQRDFRNDIWVDIKVHTELLNQQRQLVSDMKEICDNESSLAELIGATGAIFNAITAYYNERGNKVRTAKSHSKK